MDQLEPAFRILRYLPAILWSLLMGIVDWFVPMRWIAKDVSEDVVLITGAGSGLGRDIALQYAKLGSSLVLWDINEAGLETTKSLVEELQSSFRSKDKINSPERLCLTFVVDVSDRNQVQTMAEKVFEELNKSASSDDKERYVSVLVNNAGIYHGLLLQDLKDSQIERVFKINILAHFWTVRAFLPNMIKHEKGHIVEVASMGGISGLHRQVDYCATKFATVGFEESLSIELDQLGYGNKIHTTVICPFFFSSNLFTGYDSSVASIMTSSYVAKQAVWAMRCNYSRYLLPPLTGYIFLVLRSFMTRQATALWVRALGFDEGIKTIKGRAAEINVGA